MGKHLNLEKGKVNQNDPIRVYIEWKLAVFVKFETFAFLSTLDCDEIDTNRNGVTNFWINSTEYRWYKHINELGSQLIEFE